MRSAVPTASADVLKRFATEVFARAGMPGADAAVVADVLVWANLRGVDTHGVARIPRYVDLIAAGDMNPRPAISIRTETPASVLIDADRAAGPIAMTRATAEATRKANVYVDVGDVLPHQRPGAAGAVRESDRGRRPGRRP